MIWFAVFSPKKPEHWWARTYGHVALLGFSNETWVHLDLYREAVDVVPFFTHDEANDRLSYALTHFTVLKFGTAKPKSRAFFRPLTCVSFVKQVLGVRSCALLPDGLFRSLIRDYGAEIVNGSEDSSRN